MSSDADAQHAGVTIGRAVGRPVGPSWPPDADGAAPTVGKAIAAQAASIGELSL